jgi:hypothetical protein
MTNPNRHVMGEPSEGEAQIDQKVLRATVKEFIHATAWNDFNRFIAFHFGLNLGLKSTVNCLNKAVRERVPCIPFKLIWFIFNQHIPNVGNQEQMTIMTLSYEAQHLSPCGIGEQGLIELECCTRPPV